MQISSRHGLLESQHGSIEAIDVSSHRSKDDVVVKIVKSRSLKNAKCQCSRLTMVLMDSARNFDGSLTKNFGSSGASLSFYSEWKSSKIADFSLHAGCYLGQTSTSESHLLAPNGL